MKIGKISATQTRRVLRRNSAYLRTIIPLVFSFSTVRESEKRFVSVDAYLSTYVGRYVRRDTEETWIGRANTRLHTRCVSRASTNATYAFFTPRVSSLSRYDITHANESFPFAGEKVFARVSRRSANAKPRAPSITRNRGLREIAANINNFSSRHRRRFHRGINNADFDARLPFARLDKNRASSA